MSSIVLSRGASSVEIYSMSSDCTVLFAASVEDLLEDDGEKPLHIAVSERLNKFILKIQSYGIFRSYMNWMIF